MTLRAVCLWVHVLCGVIWVGACATFILAAAASAGHADDSYGFITRTVPQINRLCIPLAVAIPITGIGNLFFAVQMHRSALPPEFILIIGGKLGLLTLMVVALVAASHNSRKFHGLALPETSEKEIGAAVRAVVASYGIIVAAGIVALGLGLWLSGT